MTNRKTLILYGTPASKAQAKILLENQPFVQLITEEPDDKLRLQLKTPITDISLIPLLKPCGIGGFRLI